MCDLINVYNYVSSTIWACVHRCMYVCMYICLIWCAQSRFLDHLSVCKCMYVCMCGLSRDTHVYIDVCTYVHMFVWLNGTFLYICTNNLIHDFMRIYPHNGHVTADQPHDCISRHEYIYIYIYIYIQHDFYVCFQDFIPQRSFNAMTVYATVL